MRNLARIQHAIATILSDARFVAVDIGARGDIPEPWLVLDGLAYFFAFEADKEACDALSRIYHRRGHGSMYRVFPWALTREGGPRTLYLTRSRGGSSLFNPDIPIIRDYTNADYLDPITTTTIETRAAKDVFLELRGEPFSMMKLDIQGCELEVLESLPDEVRDGLLMIELEASMQPRNPDYPTFCEINDYMLGKDFELLDAWPDRVQRVRNGHRSGYLEEIFGVYVDSPSVSARIWEMDVLYVPRLERLLKQGDVRQLRRLVVCLGVYGFFSEALHAVDLGRRMSVLDSEEAVLIDQAIVDWHRLARRRWLYLDQWLSRKVISLMRRMDLPATTTQADYIHRFR
jgi:FkbM family methyltransferase